MSLAQLSLRRPVTAVMFYVSLVVIGMIAAFRLPLEMFPEVNVPFILVDLPYPGSTPEEVERTITRPAEEALATLTGISRMNSNSRPDGANIFILFSDWDRDIEITASEARDRLDAIRKELPDDLQRYFVLKFSPTDEPVLRVRFAGDRDFREALNPDSLRVTRGWLEPSLAAWPAERHVQFERHGYFVSDRKDHRADAPVFNRVTGLKDGWGGK